MSIGASHAPSTPSSPQPGKADISLLKRADRSCALYTYGGAVGPLHNQIAPPNRAVDNTTIWQADYNKAHYEDMYFNQMVDYYARQSSGRYTIEGDVIDWVKVPYNEARYGYNTLRLQRLLDRVVPDPRCDQQVGCRSQGGGHDEPADRRTTWPPSTCGIGMTPTATATSTSPTATSTTSRSSTRAKARRRAAARRDRKPSGPIAGTRPTRASASGVRPPLRSAAWSSAAPARSATSAARMPSGCGWATTPCSPRTAAWASSLTSTPTTSACPISTTRRVARTPRASGRSCPAAPTSATARRTWALAPAISMPGRSSSSGG